MELCVFGLITSFPEKGKEPFDPLKEFEGEAILDDKMKFEQAFRAIFGAMETMESFVRYSRYPNISVHPIAVFRQFECAAI